MTKSLTYSLMSLLLFTLSLLIVIPNVAYAEDGAKELDAKVAATLQTFVRDVPKAEEYLKEAKGVLVIPDVTKVGLVVAAQWGTGALQVAGRTVAYYKMEAASAGFQAGFQKNHFVFVFLTQDVLDKFRASNGWTVGAEAGITLVAVETGLSVDTLKSQKAIAGFSFGKEGLMAGWSGKGTKFTRVQFKQ